MIAEPPTRPPTVAGGAGGRRGHGRLARRVPPGANARGNWAAARHLFPRRWQRVAALLRAIRANAQTGTHTLLRLRITCPPSAHQLMSQLWPRAFLPHVCSSQPAGRALQGEPAWGRAALAAPTRPRAETSLAHHSRQCDLGLLTDCRARRSRRALSKAPA